MSTRATAPGPPELLPFRPDAIVDLQRADGADLVGARWRYHDVRLDEVYFVLPGADLGPTGEPNRTLDISPRAGAADYDDSTWCELAPHETRARLSSGRVCFGWYRTSVTLPTHVGDTPIAGATVVFEIVVDDYCEVWVDGRLPVSLGRSSGLASGFNAPNRVVLTQDARPGQRFQLAVFGINGPISASPQNYIWIRSATLDVYAPARARAGGPAELRVRRADPALDQIVPAGTELERIATGFEFTEGPVWNDGALLFSSPNTNTIYRWRPEGSVEVAKVKSGYSGTDVGRYHQPGSNGLTFDAQGRMLVCEHGNRRVIRVEPRGNETVLADAYGGLRLNSPNDLVCASDGTVYFTDPPFGLPQTFEDPKKELAFSGVFAIVGGRVELIDDTLAGPNGIALSPDERYLYVGNWDPDAKTVTRYTITEPGRVSDPTVLFDMTGADGDDAIDGIKVDVAGNLYVCGPGGVWIVCPDGRHLGTLVLPEAPHNLAWGEQDGRTLFVTALTSVYRVRLRIEGVRPGPKNERSTT